MVLYFYRDFWVFYQKPIVILQILLLFQELLYLCSKVFLHASELCDIGVIHLL